MLDSLVFRPNYPYREKTLGDKPKASGSTCRKDGLAEPFAFPPNYYTALALGATVVCSAGALMQYTKTGLWHQPDRSVSKKPITQTERSESATAIVTPPISTSQTGVSFSSPADNNATGCENSSCQGLDSIDRSLSQWSQLQAVNSKTEPFQTKTTLHKLQTQQAILAHRSDDLAYRQAESEKRSQTLNQQFASLTTRLAIHPKDAEQIVSLLSADTTYQINRLKLNNLKKEIAIEYSKPVVDNPQLEVLYGQYAQEMEQLAELAQNILANYMAVVSVEVSEPTWQDEHYNNMLRVLMNVAHLRQMQTIEQNTLAQMNVELSQQQLEVATLLKQNRVS